MDYQSIAYNSTTQTIESVSSDAMAIVLDSIQKDEFPGSQLYFYFRMHCPSFSIESSDFLKAAAYIYKNKVQQGDESKSLLKRYFIEEQHYENIYAIIEKAWEMAD